MLCQAGSFLYRVGGTEEDGSVSASIQYAQFAGPGEFIGWFETIPLPAPRRNAAVFASGTRLYVIGGEDETGPVNTVWFTAIQTDGSLGYGSARSWVINPRPLPEARTRAGYTIADGRLFLFGGRTADPSIRTTTALSDSIFHARIYLDGQVGFWYESPSTLLSKREYVSAVTEYSLSGETRLISAGGIGQDGKTSDLESFKLLEYGLLSSETNVTQLPEIASSVILAPDGDRFLVGNIGPDSAWYVMNRSEAGVVTGSWLKENGLAKSIGPSRARVQGYLYALSSASHQIINRLQGAVRLPEPPVIHPGSGRVPNNAVVQCIPPSNTTLRFASGKRAITQTDSPWSSQKTLFSNGGTPQAWSYAAFHEDGGAIIGSHTQWRTYHVRSAGFFVDVLSSVQPDGVPRPLSAGYHQMGSNAQKSATITWSGGGIEVFETDLYTWPVATDGKALFSSAEGSATFIMHSGLYYIQVTPSIAGESVSFSWENAP